MIFEVAEHLKLLKDSKSKYNLEQAVEELNKAQDLLNPIMDKYDYKKVTKKKLSCQKAGIQVKVYIVRHGEVLHNALKIHK